MIDKITSILVFLATMLAIAFTGRGLVPPTKHSSNANPQPNSTKPLMFKITRIMAGDRLRTEPMSINEFGTVVGKASNVCQNEPDNQYAFVYSDKTGFVNLNHLLDPGTRWKLASASDINDHGHIVGDGWINGARHIYRLTPSSVDTNGRPTRTVIEDLGNLDPDDEESRTHHINNLGEVCSFSVGPDGGRRVVSISNRNGMRVINANEFRFNNVDVDRSNKVQIFNSAGDFTIEGLSSTALLYRHGSRRLLTLDTVVTGPELDSFKNSPKFPSAINEALQITGTVQESGKSGSCWGFILTPVVP